MPRGAADVGLGRSLSFVGAFSAAFTGTFAGGAGSVAPGFGASASEVTSDVGALDGFVDGTRVVVVVARPVLRVVLVVGFPPTEAFGTALIGGGALAVAADADVEVGGGAAPVADVALATFVVGHRAP